MEIVQQHDVGAMHALRQWPFSLAKSESCLSMSQDAWSDCMLIHFDGVADVLRGAIAFGVWHVAISLAGCLIAIQFQIGV